MVTQTSPSGFAERPAMVEAQSCADCRVLIDAPGTIRPHANLTTDGASRITLADATYDLYCCQACGTRFKYRRARPSCVVTWTVLPA